MDMIKVAVIGMTGALLAMSLKNAKGDFSAYVNLGACVVVLLFMAGRLSGIIGQIETISRTDEILFSNMDKMSVFIINPVD